MTMIGIPENAAAGDIIEVKVLISHPMESGYRTGIDGTGLPRDIITGLRCDCLGEEVFRAEFFPAIAANPFLGFTFCATLTGASFT